MKEKITRMAELFAVDAVTLVDLVEAIVKSVPTSQQVEQLKQALDYAKHYEDCYNASSAVGCEVVIDTPYDTFKAFVVKDNGEYVIVDHGGESETYHSSCISRIIDNCDK